MAGLHLHPRHRCEDKHAMAFYSVGAVACQVWTRKVSCSVTIVTLSFATNVVWLVLDAKRYLDFLAMYFLLIHIQEKVRLSEAVTAWLIT